MPFLLKRTTTETFSLDLNLIDEVFDWRQYGHNIEEALALGGGPIARMAEEFLIDQFEQHDGSTYGDNLFSSRADMDCGVELIWEDD